LDIGGKVEKPTLELLRQCDFISPNEHELKRFAEDFDPFNDPPDKIRMLLEENIYTKMTKIVIKMGDKGARLIGRNYDIYMPPITAFNQNILKEMSVLDTTGAGDSFLASFMVKYLELFKGNETEGWAISETEI